MWQFFLPEHVRPYAYRVLTGAIVGLIGCGLIARVAFGWLGDEVGYATFPAAIIGVVIGPVVAWRTRHH